ncbi:hypothetical protein [Tomitella cavernea]
MDSKVQAEQARSIAVGRFGPVIARLPAPTMNAFDDALRLHLQL